VAKGLKVGDAVYVPRTRLGLSPDDPSAFLRTIVRQVVERSIVVDIPGGQSSPIASSAAQLNVGVAVVRVGDFDTEQTLLDPLAKSLLQFCRLLLPDDMVVIREVRSRAELRRFWTNDHAVYSHLVLVGHGREDAIRFGHEDWVSASNLATELAVDEVTPKVIISLCCKNGYAGFAQALSRTPVCQAAVGPFDAVHGAVASQFCQTFLAYHLLHGETLKVAFRHARKGVPGATSFRLWVKGKLTTDA
jgi:hypothetical protein